MDTANGVLVWLNLCADDGSISEQKRMFNKISSVIIVVLIFLGSIAGGVFFFKHMINDLGMALYALWLTISLSYGLYMYIVLYLSRDNMKAMYKSLTDIYDASEYRLKFKIEKIRLLSIKFHGLGKTSTKFSNFLNFQIF